MSLRNARSKQACFQGENRQPGITVNLSGIFSGTDSLQFLDFCPTTEEANARIAGVLVGKLLESAMIAPGAPTPKH